MEVGTRNSKLERRVAREGARWEVDDVFLPSFPPPSMQTSAETHKIKKSNNNMPGILFINNSK